MYARVFVFLILTTVCPRSPAGQCLLPFVYEASCQECEWDAGARRHLRHLFSVNLPGGSGKGGLPRV